jgi:PAS domain-containing protein
LYQELERQLGILNNHVAKLRYKDGGVIWASTNVHYYHDRDGKIAGMEGAIRDITDYRESQEALFQEKGRAQVTLQSIGDGVITTDVRGLIEYMNPAGEKFTGWSSDEACGQSLQRVFNLVEKRLTTL